MRLLRKFGWDWYSHCSAHRQRDRSCARCNTGRWVGPFSQWASRRWYRKHYYNGQKWVRRRR